MGAVVHLCHTFFSSVITSPDLNFIPELIQGFVFHVSSADIG